MYKKNHLSGITTSSDQKSKGKFERQNKAKKDYNERKKKSGCPDPSLYNSTFTNRFFCC